MNVIPPSQIQICRGFAACKYSLTPCTADIEQHLLASIETSGWPEYFRTKTSGGHHQQLRLALAACPNGCSRPHIADFALIASIQPVLPKKCSRCGVCQASCPEKALSLQPNLTLHRHLCLECGICIAQCPEQFLQGTTMRYRIFAGGRLGRHPVLARELGQGDLSLALTTLKALLCLFIRKRKPSERLGATLDRLMIGSLHDCIPISE